jgi:peptidoglycan/LPS O-acetylase OafA/YrhL
MIAVVVALEVLGWNTPAYFYLAIVFVPLMAVLLSYVSYTFLETYFLKLKSRYSKV